MFSLRSPSRYLLILVWVIASFGTLARGQTISGTILGTVLDQQGGILAGVGVTATNAETGLTYQAVTDTTRGLFVIPEVPPGLYRVSAQFSGFQPQEHDSVRVDVNRVTEEDFVLQIFVSTTVVVVQSAAPMTDINMATQGENFNQTQIRELPLLSRDVNNLALLAPGVESVRTFSFASTLVPFAASGSWGRYNNFIVDSVSNNEPIFGGAATQFSNPDIFSDYAILTSVPKAEFGRDSGSTVNVITKSGSSKLHGTAFWFGQKNGFNAMTRADTAALLTTTPPYYEQKIGGTLGGALGKKDTFFFLSYQFDRSRTDLSNVYPVIATAASATGLAGLRGVAAPTSALASMLAFPSVESIPGLVGQCFAATPSPVTGNAIPTSNPCYSTNVGTGLASPALAQFGTYDVPQGNLFDLYDHQASARIDRRLNDSNDLFGRLLLDDLNTPQAVLNPAGDVAFSDLGTLPDSRSVLRERTSSLLLDERLARATSLNEVRFSFSRIAQGIGAYNLPSNLLNAVPATTVADNFGYFGAYQNNFPSAGEQFTLGQDTSAAITHSNIFEVQENFSLTRNRHFIKMGADFVRTQSNIIDVPSDLGHYFFGKGPGVGTGAGCTPAAEINCGGFENFVTAPSAYPTNAVAVLQTLPDVLTNSAGVITGQGRNELPLREVDGALFIQDDFRVRPNVTVSMGLRYERFGQPINGILKLNPTAGPILPTSSGDFGPRFGIAWSPGADRKTVFRGGYALMYDQMPLNIPLLMWQSAPISPQIATITPFGAADLSLPNAATIKLPVTGNYPNSPLTWQNVAGTMVSGCSNTLTTQTAGFSSPFTVQTTAPAAGQAGVPLTNCSTQNTVAPNLATPYIQTWSVGIQRELSHNVMFEINYVGTKGTKLYQRADLNPYQGWNASCLAGGAGDACLNERPNPNRGDITAVTNAGLSTYHGLQASLNTRTLNLHGNSLTFTAAYTWSHMIDTDSEIFGPSVRVFKSSFFETLTQLPEGISSAEAITPFPQTFNNLPAERGNSSYDRRQRLVFSEIWGLPSRPDFTRAARAVLGGWFVNGVGTMQTGQPYTPLNGIPLGACADAQGEGFLTNTRPDIGSLSAPVGSVALLADPACRSTAAGYVDLNGNTIVSPYTTAHFVQVPLGTNQGGDAGRNILTGPGIFDFDFALFKQFHWGDSKTLEFRWEVYDVFNHPIYGYLLGNVFSSNAQPTPGFAFAPSSSAAAVTGAIPENAIDAVTTGVNAKGQPIHDFLSKGYMNSGNRTMQFGIHFSF